MDLAIKIEFIMLELTNNMFWCPNLELLLFVVGFIFFVVDSKEMGSVWWFLPHIVKGVIGILLLRTIPKTHEIIKNANIAPQAKLSIEDTFDTLLKSAHTGLDHFTTSMRKYLKIYFGMTVLTLLIDLLVWLSSIKDLGDESPYGDSALLALSTCYVILDGYYIAWVNSLRHRVPPYVSAAVMQAALGTMDRFYDQVGEKIKQRKQ